MYQGTIKLEGNHISFKNGFIDYDIPTSDIKDHKDILRWIKHLSEKNWITVDAINKFIITCEHHLKDNHDI